MSPSKNANMRLPDEGPTRTIFLADTLVLPEDCEYSPYSDVLWLTVGLDIVDGAYSDPELVNLLIEKLKIGDYEVGSQPLQRTMRLYVSFPLIYNTIVVRESIPHIINLLLAYKENIEAGRMSIDREYVFGGLDLQLL